jgi:flagellar P-ring protein precursor FlgI
VVHAELPPFAKPGQTLDVTVSSLGNAKSLRGGSLLMTELQGPDGEVYALAQGSLIVSGFGAEGADGSSVTVNMPSAGRIPNGAIVERGVPSPFATAPVMVMNLHSPDFTTAQRVGASINEAFGEGTAQPMDAVSIEVQAPQDPGEGGVRVGAGEPRGRPRGGAGEGGRELAQRHDRHRQPKCASRRAAVAHGNLTVTIAENINVSQPGAFAGAGQTAITPDSEVSLAEESARMFLLEPGISLQELVAAVNNAVGAAPGDLIAILEALQQAGALRAQLVVI